jgi:hypothetical protein
MFAAICAMRVPSFRMFGHLFVDAQPASDSALEERILSTRNITHASKDVLASLALSKHSGYVRLAGFHFCVIVLATLQHSRGESHVPKINCACHQMIPSHISATVSSSRPVGGSPRIENIAHDSDIVLENSRQQKIGCDRLELFTS